MSGQPHHQGEALSRAFPLDGLGGRAMLVDGFRSPSGKTAFQGRVSQGIQDHRVAGEYMGVPSDGLRSTRRQAAPGISQNQRFS